MDSDLDFNFKIYGFGLGSQIFNGLGLELGSQNKWIWTWACISFLPWIGLDFGSNIFLGLGLGFEFSNGFESESENPNPHSSNVL